MIINLVYMPDQHRVKWIMAHDKGTTYWFSGNVSIRQDADRMWRVHVDGSVLPRKYRTVGAARQGACMMKKKK